MREVLLRSGASGRVTLLGESSPMVLIQKRGLDD